MRIAYLDLFCGLSGDITLGALVNAGLPLGDLKRGLAKLQLKGYTLSSRKVMRGQLRATKLDVRVSAHGHHHTPLKKILAMLRGSDLPAPVKATAAKVFNALGRAEGAVHGIPPLKVEFHEVGAVDSIVDIVGACLGFHLLGIKRLYCSPVPVARGEIRCAHGAIPNPGPATTGLLKGFPLVPINVDREVVTPTGAAILSALVEEPGRFPEMTMESVGYGAGDWDLPERANVARIVVGTPTAGGEGDSVYLVETNLDDAPGELVGWLFDRLFAAGAVDVYATPIQMKKSRPAVKLSALCPPGKRAAVEDVLLRETPTFGVRRVLMDRTKLARRTAKVRTRYGPIRMKVGSTGDEELKAAPEYEDVRAAARKHRVPLARVIDAALAAWRAK